MYSTYFVKKVLHVFRRKFNLPIDVLNMLVSDNFRNAINYGYRIPDNEFTILLNIILCVIMINNFFTNNVEQ